MRQFLYTRRLQFEPLEDRRLLAVTGDYNGGFAVNAADYVVWRYNVGTAGNPQRSRCAPSGLLVFIVTPSTPLPHSRLK
jgi:hypothetical protein